MATTAKQMFVNLPVADLKKSIAFFTALGFEFNPQFTDDTGTCMIVGENIFVMLLTHAKFSSFAPNPIADARKTSEMIVCISADSRAQVDELVRKAVAAGGNIHNQPQDHGFMYGHGFQDPDGHIWELAYMDMAALAKMQKGG
jgi:predicted lactoylglutathione lyase